MRVNGQLAGIALVRRLAQDTGVVMHMSEFCILRKYRRQRIVEIVAREVCARFPGSGTLTIDLRNEAGLGFWRAVVAGVSSGACTGRRDPATGRIVYEFEVRAAGDTGA